MDLRSVARSGYLGAVTLAGAAVAGWLVPLLEPVPLGALVALAFLVAGEARPLTLVRGGRNVELSLSTTMGYAVLIWLGAAPAALGLAAASLAVALVRRRSLRATLFNTAQLVLAMAAAGAVVGAVAGTGMPTGPVADPVAALPALVLGGLAFHAANAALTVPVLWFHGASLRGIVVDDVQGHALWALVLLAPAPLLALVAAENPWLLLLVIAPVAVIYQSAGTLLDREHQALHDSLTGLPNRQLLFDRAEQAVRAAERRGEPCAVVVLDLDGFKEVNDTRGHPAGDAVLVAVAERLGQAVRAADTAARFGGDEFGIVLAPPTDTTEAVAVSQRLREAVVTPIEAGGATLRLGASVGIAVYPEHGADADTLVSRADAAMYRAKRAKVGPQVFSESDRTDDDRTRLLGRLAEALEGEGLALWFQPQRDVVTGEVVGAEALLRWRDQGLWVPPRELVAAAEQGGLIRPVTRYVLDHALAQADRWRSDGWQGLVTVNVSADDLADPAFPGEVGEALVRHGVPPGRLELDVAEAGLAIERGRLLEALARLRDLGVSVAVDDFGAAGINLALLRALPLSTLKIDRVLLTVGEGEAEPGVVAAAIDLGHALGLRVLAEGVETAEALARLEAVGCDLAQGYYLGRPGPAPSSPEEWDGSARGAQ